MKNNLTKNINLYKVLDSKSKKDNNEYLHRIVIESFADFFPYIDLKL